MNIYDLTAADDADSGGDVETSRPTTRFLGNTNSSTVLFCRKIQTSIAVSSIEA